MTRPLRVVVCGTTFGRVHLAALDRLAPDGGPPPPTGGAPPVVLAGILARGSARSEALAEHYRVPLFRDPAALPSDVDAACVAVRAAVVGGDGGALATALLDRGIHVLQEHPVHSDELATCLRLARRRGVVYHLNNHYLHVPAVRRFVAAAHRLYRHGPPSYVDAATGIQVAYALFDLVGRALPSLQPWGFADAQPWPETLRRLTDTPASWRPLEGVLGGTPLTLRVHHQLDPADPDNHAHLLHRVSIGTGAGNLTLLNTHGPVVWSPRMHVPRPEPTGPDPDRGFGGSPSGPHLRLASATTLGDGGGEPFHEVLTGQWPQAMARAVTRFARAIADREDPLRAGQYYLTLTRVWQEATSRLGQPEMISASAPTPVAATDLDPGGEDD